MYYQFAFSFSVFVLWFHTSVIFFNQNNHELFMRQSGIYINFAHFSYPSSNPLTIYASHLTLYTQVTLGSCNCITQFQAYVYCICALFNFLETIQLINPISCGTHYHIKLPEYLSSSTWLLHYCHAIWILVINIFICARAYEFAYFCCVDILCCHCKHDVQ